MIDVDTLILDAMDRAGTPNPARVIGDVLARIPDAEAPAVLAHVLPTYAEVVHLDNPMVYRAA